MKLDQSSLQNPPVMTKKSFLHKILRINTCTYIAFSTCVYYIKEVVWYVCFCLLLACVVICLSMSCDCQTSHCCGLLSGDKEFTVCCRLPVTIATYSWFAPSTFHPVSSLVCTALESKCFSTVLNGPWCGPHIPDIFSLILSPDLFIITHAALVVPCIICARYPLSPVHIVFYVITCFGCRHPKKKSRGHILLFHFAPYRPARSTRHLILLQLFSPYPSVTVSNC